MSAGEIIEKELKEEGFSRHDYELLNDGELQDEGDFILYWMQSAQRYRDNKALAAAAHLARVLDKPLVVGFVFMPDYPEGNFRHYSFMYDGISELSDIFADNDIGFIVRKGSPVEELEKLAENAFMVICDTGYLKPARSWRDELSQRLNVALLEISTNVIVPVRAVSDKEEYAAYTLRKKLTPMIEEHLKLWEIQGDFPPGTSFTDMPANFAEKEEFLQELELFSETPELTGISGGSSQARKILKDFIEVKLPNYHQDRNDPDCNCQSELSPYLHFGQISPREIAIKAEEAEGKIAETALEEFREELIVRRELSFNFVHYNRQYDNFPDLLPEWARKSLKKHSQDKREYTYGRQELETASTHDIYWNAAQLELIHGGKIHNYLRMYWGKKILEWTESPEKAYSISLYLNNKYALDGRDPNSYAGIAWIFGKHDRAWQERKIYGKIRYMNRNGLERKFSLDRYTDRIKGLAGISELPGE